MPRRGTLPIRYGRPPTASFTALAVALVTAALAPPTRAEPKKVVAFSDEYLALLAKGDEVARILSLGERIVFVLDSAVYEVVPAPEPEAGK